MSEKKFEDLQINCSDCKDEFTFTAGEQEFYYKQAYDIPKRCKPCRLAKKKRYETKRKKFIKDTNNVKES